MITRTLYLGVFLKYLRNYEQEKSNKIGCNYNFFVTRFSFQILQISSSEILSILLIKRTSQHPNPLAWNGAQNSSNSPWQTVLCVLILFHCDLLPHLSSAPIDSVIQNARQRPWQNCIPFPALDRS